MPTKILLIALACTIMISSVFIFSKLNANVYEESSILKVNSKEISLIISNNNNSRTIGLSGMDLLPLDKAMLFVFNEPGLYGIWMKDMKFPIDIFWLNEQKKIISIQKDVSPKTFPKVFYPKSEISYVIETNTGFADENNQLSVRDA